MADIEAVAGRSEQMDLNESGQRYIKLCIPSDYVVPDILYTGNLTPRDVGVLLDLAAKAYAVLCETSSEHRSNEIIQNAITKVRAEADHDIGILKAAHEKKEMEMNASVVQLKGELDTVNGFKVTLSSHMDKLVRAEVERAKELLGNDKTELVSQIKLAYDQVRGSQKDVVDIQLKKLHEVVEELKNLKQKPTKSSAAIGSQGEMEFAQLISRFTTWECTNTSKNPRCADFFVKIRDCLARFEIKNHTSKNVAKTEVDKFHRDMEGHLETEFGVFVSLNTGIAGLGVASSAIDIQWTKYHQMVVLVQRFKDYDTKFVFGVLESLSDVALRNSRQRANSTESSALVEYERKMTSLGTIIGKQVQDMNIFQNELKRDYKALQDTIKKQFTLYELSVANCLSGLQRLISIVNDKDLNNQSAPTGSREASNGQPAEERGVKRPYGSD